MFKRTLEVPRAPHVVVRECLGNLTVRAGSEQQITLLVLNGDEDLDLEERGETVTLSIAADCTVTCPSDTTLRVERVLGNLRIEDVEGSLDLDLIRGNVALRRVGPVSLDEALGNLSAREVAGGLEALDVKGNAHASAVEGPVKLAEVAGNLMTEGLAGGLEAEKVRGNVRLGPPFSPGVDYRVNASGNLTVRVPADASLRLTVRARGHSHSSIPGLDLERHDGAVEGTLGDGEATLEADVRGNLALRPDGSDDSFEGGVELEELGAHIEHRVHEALAEMATRLEASLGRVDPEAVKRRVERTTERARRKAERAAEQARLRAERAERRWQRASGHRARPEQAATDEERLRVLRMVEEGKLTPEQASELLAALEGS